MTNLLLLPSLPYLLGVALAATVASSYGWWMAAFAGVFATAALAMISKEISSRHFRTSPNADGKDTCIITGATHGIGYAIAEVFARDGYNLIIAARHQEELDDAERSLRNLNSKIRVVTISKDFFHQESADEFFEEVTHLPELQNGSLRITCLVNNVGFCIRGDFLDLPYIDQLGQLQLNTVTLTKLCYLFGGRFRNEIIRTPASQQVFRIMNVSSFASVIVCPFLSVYSGTKAYAHSFSLAFAEELKASKYMGRITVTSLCPGYTLAPSLIPAGILNSVAIAIGNHDPTTRVARAGYKAMMSGQTYVLVGYINNLLYWASSTVLPTSWSSKFAKFMNADFEEVIKPRQVMKEGLTAKRGWKSGTVASEDLRKGMSHNQQAN